MKKLLSLFAVAILVTTPAFAGEGHSKSEASPYTEINAEQLNNMIENDENLVIIDARSKNYIDGSVIKGAKILSSKDTNANSLSKLAPNKDANVVFYCSNEGCAASKYSAVKADKEGYKNLYKYPGGIDDWEKKGLPVEKI